MQIELLQQIQVQKLSQGFPKHMVLLDVETTGGRAAYHRVIEIGLIIVEDGDVIETWQTFINPESVLPTFIQTLTGISPAMLEGAPLFRDIAEVLFDKLQNRVLVAHNARFDYGFLKNEFSRVGINYAVKPLCSVKFSRAMFPQFRRHGLDQIILRFKFSIENRHRALDDALVIHKFFLSASNLFDTSEIRATCELLVKTATLPALLDPKEIERLPNSPGVYYFYDEKGQLLYIGKSVTIRSRVLSHFSQDHKNHKDLKMSSRIAHIDYVSTPTDFGAQLLESREIKSKQPLFNSRLRKVKKLLQIKLKANSDGYLVPSLETVEVDHSVSGKVEKFGLFRSRRQALTKLEKLADQFFLCHQLLGLENSNGCERACFRFQLKRCFGACCKRESSEQYNQRLLISLKEYKKQVWPYNGPVLVVETGSYDKKNEQTQNQYHLLDQWVYHAKLATPEELYDHGLVSLDKGIGSCLDNNEYNEQQEAPDFDIDIYFILVRFLINPSKHELHGLNVVPLIYMEAS